MNRILLFILGKLKGYYPMCDRCLDTCNYRNKLSFVDYMTHSKNNCVYCTRCWNWIHLKKGTCSKCGSKMTHRSEKSNNTKICVCGNEIQMEVSN